MAITAQFIADFNAFIASTRAAEQGLQKLEAKGKDVGNTIDTVKGIANDLAGAFGLAFSATALVNFAKAAIEGAATLGDLAAATGLTTDGLQRLAYVGQGFGVNIDEMSRAVGNLSTRLASGDASAVAAVQSLGLSVTRLLASGPQDAFLAIAEATGRIEDPMQKGAIAAALFGDKLAKILLPALRDLRTKMEEVPQDALISKATIDSANEFELSLKHGVTRLEAWTAKILFAWSEGDKAAAAAATVLSATARVQAELGTAQTNTITTADLLSNRLTALRTQALEPLTKAQQATAGELLFYGEAQKDVARLLGVSESSIRLFIEAEKASTVEMNRASVAAEAWAAVILDLNNKAFANSKKEFDEWSARLTITTDRVTAAILKESEAQTVLNASHGLTALGANKVTSAEETLRLGMEALHRTREGSIAQTAQEQLLYDAYTKALYDAAVGTDTVNLSISRVPPVAGAAAAAVNGLTASYWAAVDAAAALSGIPSIGHRAPSIEDPGFTSPPFGGGGLHPLGGTHPLRAAGGPGVAGTSYLVGEKGPELYTPGASGFFTPGGGSTVVNHIYVNGTAEDVARQIADKIKRTLMQSTKLVPS